MANKMPKQKHVPIRTCIACREARPKKEMIRIVRTKEGEVFVDGTGKIRGRGANICSNGECLEKAIDSKSIERSLETDELDYESITADFKNVLSERTFRQGQKKVTIRVMSSELDKLNK